MSSAKGTEILTIQVSQNSMIVRDGKLPKSKLKYRAPGLEIYLIGEISVSRRAGVNQVAFDICIARHIPLISLSAQG